MKQYYIEFLDKHGDAVYEEYFSCENKHEAMAQADYIGANLDRDFDEIIIREIRETE